jgi:hypothetical protein
MYGNAPQASAPASTSNTSLEGDITLLTSLLSQSASVDEGDIEGAELQELLRRLETADGVARGVESRLDEIIGSLDQMLGSLEGVAAEGKGGGRVEEEEDEKGKVGNGGDTKDNVKSQTREGKS